MTLPACAIEVIQAQSEQELIKSNTRKFNEGLGQETNDGIYIPNPIDYINSKKQEFTAPPPKESSTISLDCDKMEYKDDENAVAATGHVVIMTYPDNVKLTSDRAILNHDENYIKLFDNVKLYKDGGIITGDYMVVDLNKENILMNEPIGSFDTFKITSREGYAYANKIETINGDMELAEKLEMRLESNGFGSFYDTNLINEEEATFEMRKKRSEPYRIKTHEIVIKGGKNHDEIVMKDAEVYYKKLKLLRAPELNVYTDKEQSYIESNFPEIGSLGGFGTYFGPGFVFKTPGNSTTKVAPAAVFKSGAGIGVIVKHRSKRNELEAGWATSSKNLVLRGKYHINKDLQIEYSRRGYIDEWLNGYRRPGYMLQLAHKKTWKNEDLDAYYTQRVSAGYASDYIEDNKEQEHTIGTMRLGWQAELGKQIFGIENKEQNMYFRGFLSGQVSTMLYGTGDFTAFAKMFPYIESRVKGWGSRIYAGIGGVHGRSPFYFDDYRYGKVSFTIDESFRLCKYLTLGYRGTLSPLRDNWENELLTENMFYAMVGPEDFKIALSHDSVRDRTAVDVVFLFGSDNAKIQYDKLSVEDPSKVGKKSKWIEEWKLRKIKVPNDEAI